MKKQNTFRILNEDYDALNNVQLQHKLWKPEAIKIALRNVYKEFYSLSSGDIDFKSKPKTKTQTTVLFFPEDEKAIRTILFEKAAKSKAEIIKTALREVYKEQYYSLR